MQEVHCVGMEVGSWLEETYDALSETLHLATIAGRVLELNASTASQLRSGRHRWCSTTAVPACPHRLNRLRNYRLPMLEQKTGHDAKEGPVTEDGRSEKML